MIDEKTNASRGNEGVILAIAQPNPEVQDKPTRRRFTAEYILKGTVLFSCNFLILWDQ